MGNMIFNESYNEMNIIKQVKHQSYESHSNRYTHTQYQHLPYTQNYTINSLSRKYQYKMRAQMTQQREQRQTLQSQAKTHLFEQSEIRNHKEVNKSYELVKNQKKISKSMMLQTQQQITAFEYDHEPTKKTKQNLQKTKNAKSNESNPHKRRELRFQIPNHQIYWNKKKHAQVMILRPTILHPSVINERHYSQTKNTSLDKEETNKKDFQKIINKIARTSKDSSDNLSNYNIQNIQKFKKRARIRSIERKIVHLRSKSTNFIEEYQNSHFLTQLEKVRENSAFDLQIKCLKSQKELIEANKTKTVKSNKDLKQKVRHLITKQSKGNHKKQLKDQSFTQDFQIKDQVKSQKLQIIHNRSTSCIVSSFKGGENKKVKIGHILSKFAKFKTQELQKRKMHFERQKDERNKSSQLLKIHIKINQNTQKQKWKAQPVLKINQDHLDSDIRKGLINSIKFYCNEKNTQQLPFVTKTSKTTNMRP